MMLNGLPTSSKTLPLDTSAARLLPVDAETTETVSFGKLLKLKEKQLQQVQEVSASFVAAAFASLQTPQLVDSLPNSVDISARGAIKPTETAADHPVSSASTIEKASPPEFNAGTTTKINFAGEAINTDTITASQTNRNPEISTQPLPISSITTNVKSREKADSPIYFAAQTVILPKKEGGPQDNAILTLGGIKSTNNEATISPNIPFQVRPNQEASKSFPSVHDASVGDEQESSLQMLEAPAASQPTKTHSTETNKTSEFVNTPGFVQIEIKKNIGFHQTDQKDSNVASNPLPVQTTEDVPTRNSPTQIGTDNSTIQQATTSVKEQQSNSSRPAFSSSFSFASEIDETEKMKITSPVEDQSKDEALPLRTKVEEIGSTAAIHLTEIPVSKSAIKQQFAASTGVNLRSIDVAFGISLFETPIELSVPHEVELPAVNTFVQPQDNSIWSYQSAIPTVTTQFVQSAVGEMGTNVTKNGQTAQTASTPVINDVPLEHAQAGFTDILAADRIVKQLSVTQSEKDLKDTSQGSDVQAELMSAQDKETTGTANTFDADIMTQKFNTASGDARLKAGEVPSPIETPNSSPISVFSNRLSALTDDTLPNLQFEGVSQGTEVSKTKVVGKEGSSASEHPLTGAGSVQTSDHPETVSVFRLRNDAPGSAPIEPTRYFSSDGTVTASTEATATLEIEPEKETSNQQVIISRSDQDLSYSATTISEQNITLAFETVEKKINISTESSNIQDKRSTNLSSDVVLPTRLELGDREADISLRISSAGKDSLIKVFTSDATSNLRASQSIKGNTETKSNQGLVAVEIPISEQIVARPSEIPASGFEINTRPVHVEPNSKQKGQGSKAILGNLGVATKSETPETSHVSSATVMSMDLPEKEKFVSQAMEVESERPADLRRDVLSKTDSALGSKNVEKEVLTGRESSISADARIETSYVKGNQSGLVFTQGETEIIGKTEFENIESRSSLPGNNAKTLHLDMRVSVDDDLSKMIKEENIQAQTARKGKTFETMPQTFNDASFQTEVVKVLESKNKETEIHSEMRMDRSVQNGTVPFHENKNNTDIEVKPKDPNTPVDKPDEMAATHKASKNDAIPVTNQAPKVVEIGNDTIASALSKAHPVRDSHDIQKTNQIENDEKALPVEKQPGLNQTPGIATPANSPGRETTASIPGENVPLNQLHGDVKEVVEHVIRHINSNIKNGPTSMRLQLSPRELGAIDVQMVSDSQGVHVTFFAEQVSTGKLLETQLERLRVSLVDSGVHLSGLDIGQHNQSGQKGECFEQSPNFTRDFSRNFPDAQTGSQEKPSLERSLGRSSDIDYLI